MNRDLMELTGCPGGGPMDTLTIQLAELFQDHHYVCVSIGYISFLDDYFLLCVDKLLVDRRKPCM